MFCGSKGVEDYTQRLWYENREFDFWGSEKGKRENGEMKNKIEKKNCENYDCKGVPTSETYIG